MIIVTEKVEVSHLDGLCSRNSRVTGRSSIAFAVGHAFGNGLRIDMHDGLARRQVAEVCLTANWHIIAFARAPEQDHIN